MQSTLAIRWSYAGHMLVIGWHTLVIRYSYAPHKFNTVSICTILYFHGLFVRMKIILGIFHTHLVRFSHTQQCDRAINHWKFIPAKCSHFIVLKEHMLMHHTAFYSPQEEEEPIWLLLLNNNNSYYLRSYELNVHTLFILNF